MALVAYGRDWAAASRGRDLHPAEISLDDCVGVWAMLIVNDTEGRRDPDVVLPADVQVSVDRAASKLPSACALSGSAPQMVTSVLGREQHLRREAYLDSLKSRTTGGRGQPPMIDRLRAAAIYTDHLEQQGVRFATARTSIMNREVRDWLNTRMGRSADPRKSRRKIIGEDAIRALLRQLFALRADVSD
jgi:hypothetical protein